MLLGIIGVRRDPLDRVDNNRFLFNIALSIATWFTTRHADTDLYNSQKCSPPLPAANIITTS